MLRRLPPAVLALLLQGAALALTLLLARVSPWQFSTLVFSLSVGSLAALFSHLAGQARWWMLIQFVFVPALMLALALHIAPGIYLALFLVFLAVYWSAYRSQVPLYLSSRRIWQGLELLLPPPAPDKSFAFADLGSGIGGVLTHLARARPDGRYFGVESAPLPLLLSRWRIRLSGLDNCETRWGSLWDCDLSQYDVVYAYLSPAPMEKLWQKARREMRPGAALVSNSFAIPEQPPQQTYTVDDLHRSTLYIWYM